MTSVTTVVALLVLVLQFATSDGTTDHPKDAVVAHLFASIATRQTAANGTHDTAVTLSALRGIGVVRSIRILVARLLLLLLMMLRLLVVPLPVIPLLAVLRLLGGSITLTLLRLVATTRRVRSTETTQRMRTTY